MPGRRGRAKAGPRTRGGSAGAKKRARPARPAPAAAPDADADRPAPRRLDLPPVLVAAGGASAGGLPAFTAMLRAIPGDAPLALVLEQHLARAQPSILPELLGNVAKMKVLSPADEIRIQPAHASLTPPDARMTIPDGHLRVRPAGPQRERQGTVDLLFRSIAQEYRDRAIGV